MFPLNKNIVILCLFLLLLNGVSADNVKHIGYIKINYRETTEIYNFSINKMEDCTYILTFEHYGNINESMRVEIYLNEKLIYTIDDPNDSSSRYKKNVNIDITSDLTDGNNELKVKGINLVADPNRNYHPYYVLNKTSIICKPSTTVNTTVKVPVSIVQVIICLITTVLTSLKYLTNNYREFQ